VLSFGADAHVLDDCAFTGVLRSADSQHRHGSAAGTMKLAGDET
jgi:hypothetical protein